MAFLRLWNGTAPRCGDIPRIVTPRGRVRPRLPLGPLYVVVAAGTGGEASGRSFAGPTGAPGDLHQTATTLDESELLVFAASNGANVRKNIGHMARVIVALLLTTGAALQQPGPRPRAPTAKNAVPCAEADALLAQARHLRDQAEIEERQLRALRAEAKPQAVEGKNNILPLERLKAW